MSRRSTLIVALVILGGIGWFAFRPERLFINRTVAEALPSASAGAATAGPRALVAGQFHSNAHETRGTATIYRYADGRRVLRLTGFETSNGPDVQVYLVAAADVQENETVKQAGFINLGAMKGNIGDQNYDIPADADLDSHRTVTIWCRRFGVNFGSAPLEAAAPSGPAALTSGMFHSNAHETRGTATVYRLEDGSRVLRLTGFETSNGPDVQVYLVAAADVMENATVKDAGFVNLGGLKGNVGDQNYVIPSDLDLATYRTVTIWCRRFGVNFGSAPLGATATQEN